MVCLTDNNESGGAIAINAADGPDHRASRVILLSSVPVAVMFTHR